MKKILAVLMTIVMSIAAFGSNTEEKTEAVNSTREELLAKIETEKAKVKELMAEAKARLKELKDTHLTSLRKADYYSKPVYPSTQIFFNYSWESSGKSKDRTRSEFSDDIKIIADTLGGSSSSSGASVGGAGAFDWDNAYTLLKEGNGTVSDDKRFVETIDVGANIKPAEPKIPSIGRDVTLDVETPDVTLGALPNPSVTPLSAPIVATPTTIGAISSPAAVSVNVTLPGAVNDVTVVAPSIETPGAPVVTTKNVTIPKPPEVTAPTVNNVESTAVSITAGEYSRADKPYNSVSGDVEYSSDITTTKSPHGAIGVWRMYNNVTFSGKYTVNVADSRAIIIDEVIHDTNYYITKEIELNYNKNVGIDLQGTHLTTGTNNTKNWADPVDASIFNTGKITGAANTTMQLGMGFNNYDNSSNASMTRLINKGTITMNGNESMGIQLKPEDPSVGGNSHGPTGFGYVMMQALNDTNGTINMNGNSSYALSTVGWAGGTTGAFGTYANNDNFNSSIENKGTINIKGNNSIGIALLHPIQSVKNSGTINITGGTGAIGVYSEVATAYLASGSLDEGGTSSTSGNGTQTVEVNGTINIATGGETATQSAGVRTGKTDGKITVQNGAKINAGSSSNSEIYGAVQASSNGSIDIENGATIKVSGDKSIGYAITNGTGENNGNIEATYTASSSEKGVIGVYNAKGTFTNSATGKIKASGSKSNAVVLEPSASSPGDDPTFNNTGLIEIGAGGSTAVYNNGGTFTHNTGTSSLIKVADDAVGVFNNNGTSTIKGKMEIGAGGGMAIGVIKGIGTIVTFDTGANLDIKKGSIGLYALDATGNFTINNMTASLGQDSILAYYDKPGTGTHTLDISNVILTAMGSKSSLVYADKKLTSGSGAQVTVTDTTARDITSFANPDAIAYVANGLGSLLTVNGDLKTNTKVGMASTDESSLVNNKKLEMVGSSGRANDTGIYANNSTITNGGTGIITTSGSDRIVGMFGEASSTINNAGTINLHGTGTGDGDIGIYALNSTVNDSGTINITKDKSVGAYLKNSDMNLNIGTAFNFNSAKNNVGVYLDGTKTLTISTALTFASDNDNNNILIYAKNGGTINNNNVITVDGNITPSGNARAIGVYLDGTGGINTYNGGTLSVTNQAVGIYSNDNNTISLGTLNVDQASTVGAYLNGPSTIKGDVTSTNQAVGIYGKGGKVNVGPTGNLSLTLDTQGVGMYLSSGAYASGNDINMSNNDASHYNVGIYYDPTSQVTHDANIIMNTTKHEAMIGIYVAPGKSIVDAKNIAIDSDKSIGAIAGTGATFTSNGAIDANGANTLGEYTEDGTINNAGTINANGTYSTGMAAIGSSTAKVNNSGTINAFDNTGIYLGDNGGNSIGTSSGTISTTTGTDVYVKGANSTFANNGTLDITGSLGIGIFLEDTAAGTITPGTITASADGIGVYAKNSPVDFDVNVNGNSGAIGIIGENGSNITGNISVGDNGVGLYVMDGTVVTGSISVVTGANGTGIFLSNNIAGAYNLSNVDVNAVDGLGIYLEGGTSPSIVDLALSDSNITTTGGTALYVGSGSKLTSDGNTINIDSNSSGNLGIGVYIGNGGIADIGNGTNTDTINFISVGGIGIYNDNGILNLGSNLVQVGNGTIAATVNGDFSYAGTSTLSGVTALLGIYDGSMTAPKSMINTGNITITDGGIAVAAIQGTSSPTMDITMTNNSNITSIGTSAAGQPSIGIYTDVAKVENPGTIVASDGAIGIYTSSGKDITNSSITLTGAETTGLYIKDSIGNIITNNIVSTDPANTGAVIDNITGGTADLGIISLGNESVGTLATNGSTINIDGNIIVGNGSLSKRAIGVISAQGSAVTMMGSSFVSVGEKGIGAYIDNTSSLDVNGSSLSVGTDGIYVYSNGGNITLNGGSINADNNIGMIFDGGTFTNVGGNLTSDNGAIGIYVKNNDVTSITDNFVTVQNSTGTTENTIGIYYDNVTAGINIPLVNQSGTNTVGVTLNNTDGIANNQVTISGDPNQIGIVAQGTSNVTANSGINVNGDMNTGIYAKGGAVTVNGNISIGNSTADLDMKLSSIGIYQNGNTFTGNGDLNVGAYSIGVYGESLTGTSVQNGNINTGNNAVGAYIIGTTGSDIYQVTGNTTVGDSALGIYNKKINTIINGDINVGNNEAIGIVSEGNGDITYNGSITVGDNNSLGIYKKVGSGENANITNTASTWNVGKAGYGIYALEASGDKTGNISLTNAANMILDTSALGIYASGNVSFANNGDITVGMTDLGGDTTPDHIDSAKHLNSVGIYVSEGATAVNNATLTVGNEHSVGVYALGNGTVFTNDGTISVDNGAVGMLIRDGATGINNNNIIMGSSIPSCGAKNVGMAAYSHGTIINKGMITVGAGVGMMVGFGGYLDNEGTINVYNGIGIQGEGKVINKGNIILSSPSAIKDMIGVSAEASVGAVYISSDGTIKVNDQYTAIGGTLYTDGVIEVDGAYADVTSGVPLFSAKSITGIINILPNFAMTGNGKTYEIDNFLKVAASAVTGSKLTPMIGPLFVAKVTDAGTLIIVKRPYSDVTVGNRFDTLYEGWDKILEEDPYSNDSMALKSMNTYLASITDTDTFSKESARMLSETRGDIYATIQKRMENIQNAFDTSFEEMLNSYNFSKDTGKYSIMYRNGKYKDPTLGIDDYDYNITGLMYMKEKEGRIFGNKHGYSLGFAASRFDFDDSEVYDSDSKENVYSLRAGMHNVNNFSDDDSLRLVSRIELGYNRHEAKRKLELEVLRTNKANYDTYSVTLDNKLEKTFYRNYSSKVDGYLALNMEYGAVDGFTETRGHNGGMLLKVKSNDYFSIQPEVGVNAEKRFYVGKKFSMKVEGSVAYAYELGENYDGNKVRPKATKSGWTSLIEPEKEKGIAKGTIGVSLEKANHYGVTFDVETAKHQNKKNNDVRFGVRFNYKFGGGR